MAIRHDVSRKVEARSVPVSRIARSGALALLALLVLAACKKQPLPPPVPMVEGDDAAPPRVASTSEERDPRDMPVARDDRPERGIVRLPCAEESRLRSLVSETSLHVDFSNTTDDDVSLYWLDFHGSRVHYNDLAPGESYRQQTYVTHPWVAVDPHKRCVGLFVPNAGGIHAVTIDGSGERRQKPR